MLSSLPPSQPLVPVHPSTFSGFPCLSGPSPGDIHRPEQRLELLVCLSHHHELLEQLYLDLFLFLSIVPAQNPACFKYSAAAAKSFQSCLTLCDPMDGSLPGFPVPGILQARTLEWVAISFSNAWKWKVKSESEVAQSCWTLRDPTDCSPPGFSVHGFSRQEYWSGVPLPSPESTV